MTKPLVLLAAALLLALSNPAAAQTKPRPAPARKAPVAKPALPASKVEPPAPIPPPPAPPSDVKVTTAYTMGAQVSQNVTYLRGPRQRVEFPGLVSLDQCDLQRTVLVNPTAKRYRIELYPAAAAPAPAASPASAYPGLDPAAAQVFAMAQQPQQQGGVVTMTTTLTDTLERQTFFGLEARHIKIVVSKVTSGKVCDATPMRTEIDAWYVDLPRREGSCTRPTAPPPAPASGGGCQDRIETRVVGDVTLGFPIKMTTTTTTGEGGKLETTSTTAEVSALEITRLDAALFNVPADFVEAKSGAELAPAIASGGSLADALFGSTADGTSAAAPKKPGTIRIGVLEPVNRSTRSLQTRALRATLVGKYNKAPYDALPLNGSSASAIEADAKRLECDYILFTDIKEVKTSKPGKLGGMLKAASGGGPPKDVHEVKVDYRLFAVSATQAAKASGEAKASSGGGFGIGSALRIAAFAGQMYMGMGMGMGGMRGMGMFAGGGLGPMMGGMFDPRAMAMSSMATSMSSGMMSGMSGMPGMGGDMSDAEVFETVSNAMQNAARASTEQLKRGK